MRRNRRSLFEFLQVICNHLGAVLQAAGYDSIVTNLRTECDIHDVHFVIGSDRVNLFGSLHFLHRSLWNQKRIATNLRCRAHTTGLSRPQNFSRVWKGCRDSDCTSLLIQLTVDKDNASLVRIGLAIGRREG